jgi:hypothetical protein
MSIELSSVGWTLYYICKGSGFEPQSFHLWVKFQVIKLHDQKDKNKNNNIKGSSCIDAYVTRL